MRAAVGDLADDTSRHGDVVVVENRRLDVDHGATGRTGVGVLLIRSER